MGKMVLVTAPVRVIANQSAVKINLVRIKAMGKMAPAIKMVPARTTGQPIPATATTDKMARVMALAQAIANRLATKTNTGKMKTIQAKTAPVRAMVSVSMIVSPLAMVLIRSVKVRATIITGAMAAITAMAADAAQ